MLNFTPQRHRHTLRPGHWLREAAYSPCFHVILHCILTLTVLHERLLLPLVVPASVMVPHIGVVSLGVLVLDPSGGGGDGDDVKNNGEEQQQGHDPPASGVGDPTAEHDGRSECVGAG